jgi:hypothetical protein
MDVQKTAFTRVPVARFLAHPIAIVRFPSGANGLRAASPVVTVDGDDEVVSLLNLHLDMVNPVRLSRRKESALTCLLAQHRNHPWNAVPAVPIASRKEMLDTVWEPVWIN